MNDGPNSPVPITVAGVDCHVYPAEQYAAVDADVAEERKGDRSAGAVAREISRWAGIRSASNLKWLLDEMLADANRASFESSQIELALKRLLFALHARPMHGYELLSVEEAIEQANQLLDAKFARANTTPGSNDASPAPDRINQETAPVATAKRLQHNKEERGMDWQPDMVIYHSPCDDGFAAAWACWMRWGDAVEYVPGTYGKPAPDVRGKRVLIVDFSFKRDVLAAMGDVAEEIVILDHHKTAQADLAEWSGWTVESLSAFDGPSLACAKACTETGRPIVAAFEMERSGARLAWDFCNPDVSAPMMVRLIEDRDLWRFSFSDTKPFSLWLRSHPYDFAVWSKINDQLQAGGEVAGQIYSEAAAIQRFYDQKIGEMVAQARPVTINGTAVPAVNCSWAFASDVAHALLEADPAAPFAATYYDRGDGSRTFSLRSEDHRADVSAVAKRYGGGGHRNAAGFEVPAV